MASESWIVENIQNAFNVWNAKMAEIWTLISQSPAEFKGGAIWSVIRSVSNALTATGLALVVLFFAMGIMKSTIDFSQLKRPEQALKFFLRFVLAKTAVTYGLEIITAIFEICQGVIAKAMSAVGGIGSNTVAIPDAIVKKIEAVGFFESIPLWAVTLLGSLFITVLSFVMILSIYGRFLDSDTEALMAVGRKHLCQVATLRYQQSDGLHTALPYGVRRTDTLRTMTTESTAILMPFNTQEMFATNGVCYGRNIISKNLISIDRKSLLNGNGFFLGVSGSGKSFLSKEEIVAIATGTDDDIIIIDPEREYTMLIQALGGEVIRISATSRHHINAMDISRDYGDEENPVLLKSEFILSLCEMAVGSGGLSAREKSLIDRCIASVYQGYIARNYTGNPPTLAHFHQELLKQPEQEAREIALALELFTQGSLNTFARHTNVDTENRILCFDIHDLGSQLKPIGMLVVLDAIYNRIARNRAMKKNTWIYVDEIYLMFRSEYSSNFLFELWKRVRKYGAFCTGISQNIEDMLQSHVARAMLGNSEFLVLLNQSASDRAELSRLLNISGTQLNYITNAEAGTGLIKCGGSIIPFESKFPTDTRLYSMMTTKLDEQL